MQHRYVGDAGDFAKYSLLSSLTNGDPCLRLGVFWYLFPNENHNDDGRHVSYLKQPDMRLRNPAVHGALDSIVRSGLRSIQAVEDSSILPSTTLFFSEVAAIQGKPDDRSNYRLHWFARGLQRLRSCDLLFLDPDNGIETVSLKKSDFRAGKYVFWREIEQAWGTGKSLVIYNHLNRTASASMQTAKLKAELSIRLPSAEIIVPLLFRRGSCRHLWVIGQRSHAESLSFRIRQFLAAGWQADTDCDLD